VTTILTLGTTDPEGSVTVPTIVPVVCPNALNERAARVRKNAARLRKRRFLRTKAKLPERELGWEFMFTILHVEW
jgi:hypothetical protein